MLKYSNINRFSGAKTTRKSTQTPRRKRNTISLGESAQNWTNSFNYLEPEIIEPKMKYSEQHTLEDGRVVWNGATQEQLNFMQTVYDINYTRYSRRGTPYPELSSNELETVLGNYKLRKEASPKFKALLEAAKTAINKAGVDVKIALNSAYRSPTHQFNLWMDYFPNYYNETQDHRASLEGGQHGDKAAQYLAKYVRSRISTPGFSNHNNGLAIDIRNTEKGEYIKNKTKAIWIEKWKSSWLWTWLVANANTYNFYQETSINEPWHWVFRQDANHLTSSQSKYGRALDKRVLKLKERVPNMKEYDVVGRISGKILRGTPEFDELIKNENQKIVFKDEEGTGADHYMTSKLSEKLNLLADLVIQEWGANIKLRVTEAWDEDNEHASKSIHYEGRGADITTSDRDSSKLGRLARLAVEVGLDWVFYEDNSHVHVSMKK
ncbi:hypothetical protein A8C32_01830 [Flavivirga aquatica]|uniref:Peptidase M15B domain-containing protein n=1 Tax=Flavivirga aquatica TaxID=1849968 RepID=A0A1E5TA52_9FLAO|nr:D-alanyl-D-alanine carboxypeptidase family protein [Flavivirga aquatica]OEK08228.1 hypothetical protein A8C32_01830 [Flavivirga aquatica]